MCGFGCSCAVRPRDVLSHRLRVLLIIVKGRSLTLESAPSMSRDMHVSGLTWSCATCVSSGAASALSLERLGIMFHRHSFTHKPGFGFPRDSQTY